MAVCSNTDVVPISGTFTEKIEKYINNKANEKTNFSLTDLHYYLLINLKPQPILVNYGGSADIILNYPS